MTALSGCVLKKQRRRIGRETLRFGNTGLGGQLLATRRRYQDMSNVGFCGAEA
jgi:hypothetical protein